MPNKVFKHLIDKRKWKVIFLGCVIQFTIVDAYAPSSDRPLRDELILLIFYYGHSSLFWDNMDRTYPRTIGDRVDCVKGFYDFLYYHFLDVGVYSSLRLDTWFELIFHENLVSAEGRVDPFNVCNTPCYHPFMIPKYLEEPSFFDGG
ncbi:hypothetical protein Tco_0557954 [Tanacetum coccineum]